MLINLETLPLEKLKLIPLSIRIDAKNNNNLIDTDQLPYEIVNQLFSENKLNLPNPVIFEKTIDFIPKLNIYNDFQQLTSKKEAIIEYIKNYFIVNRGNYPFDPTFGTKLKYYLQNLDTGVSNLLITQEANDLAEAISRSFQIPVKITNFKVFFDRKAYSTEAKIYLDVDVGEQQVTEKYSLNLIVFIS